MSKQKKTPYKIETETILLFASLSKRFNSDAVKVLKEHLSDDKKAKQLYKESKNNKQKEAEYKKYLTNTLFTSPLTQKCINDLSSLYLLFFITCIDLMNKASVDIYQSYANTNRIKAEKNASELFYTVNDTKAFMWNERRIRACILDGIRKGKSIDEIADSLIQVTNSTKNDAIRKARTVFNGVVNKAEQDKRDILEKSGKTVLKQWVTTVDERTRTSHLEMHGETVPNGDKFSNGLMYPGDPNGTPEQIMNCRCKTKTLVVDRK